MLKLRVDFRTDGKQRQKYYSLGKSLSVADWAKFRSGSVPPRLRKIREEALQMEVRANDIVNNNPTVKPELFEALLIGRYSEGSGVSQLFNEAIAKFEQEGRIGTKQSYEYALKSLIEYRGDFPLEIVDTNFLKGYETWMREAGRSATTTGMYLRNLRAVFNVAIGKKLISRDLYPFGKEGYTIPTGSNHKKALKSTDNVSLQDVTLTDPREHKAISFWLFSYYCNGMNFTDMAYLRPSDIKGEVLTFIRRKTMRTVRKVKPIVVPLRPEVLATITLYGTHEPYVFGIINKEMSPKEAHATIHQWVKTTNKFVNRVATRIGITHKVNTYNARHTFATMLLKAKVDIKAIQQSLGHVTMSTTEAYLADMDTEEAKQSAYYFNPSVNFPIICLFRYT
ncbi:MAG: site-specific integrase [Chryseolinea sp.]